MIKLNNKVVNINKFPDGTILMKEEVSEYAEKAYITWNFESNEELVALIYLTHHLHNNGIKKVYLFMPYIPNARQDRVKNPEDVFTLKYFAWVINSLEFEEVTVVDPHSSVSEALINNINIITPQSIIQRIYNGLSDGNLLLFYPDEGAMKRYSSMFQAPYAFGIKERNWSDGKIKCLSVCDCGQTIKGKNILIIDDISSRGGTFYHSAKKLKELGAEKIFLYITHCENTILEGELLSSDLIEKVYTTNSLFTAKHEKIEVIEV